MAGILHLCSFFPQSIFLSMMLSQLHKSPQNPCGRRDCKAPVSSTWFQASVCHTSDWEIAASWDNCLGTRHFSLAPSASLWPLLCARTGWMSSPMIVLQRYVGRNPVLLSLLKTGHHSFPVTHFLRKFTGRFSEGYTEDAGYDEREQLWLLVSPNQLCFISVSQRFV